MRSKRGVVCGGSIPFLTTPEGLFSAPDSVLERIHDRIGPLLSGDVLQANQLFESHLRYSLLEDFWAGAPLQVPEEVRGGVGRPPTIEFVDIPRSTTSDAVPLRVRVRDRGGGVGEVRLFVGSSPVRRGRRCSLGSRERARHLDELTFDVVLSPGENTLRAVAFATAIGQATAWTRRLRRRRRFEDRCVLWSTVLGVERPRRRRGRASQRHLPARSIRDEPWFTPGADIDSLCWRDEPDYDLPRGDQ